MYIIFSYKWYLCLCCLHRETSQHPDNMIFQGVREIKILESRDPLTDFGKLFNLNLFSLCSMYSTYRATGKLKLKTQGNWLIRSRQSIIVMPYPLPTSPPRTKITQIPPRHAGRVQFYLHFNFNSCQRNGEDSACTGIPPGGGSSQPFWDLLDLLKGVTAYIYKELRNRLLKRSFGMQLTKKKLWNVPDYAPSCGTCSWLFARTVYV